MYFTLFVFLLFYKTKIVSLCPHSIQYIDLILVSNQWWRLFSSLFIHEDLGVLFLNIIILLMFISTFEYFMTPVRTLVVFLFGGIGGVFMATSIVKDGYVPFGAGPGVFAIVGSGLGYMVFNWKRMDHEKSPRYSTHLLQTM